MTAGRISHRIAYLDGLRCVAILSVLAFHYLARWTHPLNDQNLYPYGASLAGLWIAKYGGYGVQLFFAISGFVIALTLERCAGFYEFAVRRFARLWPNMALCATLTYVLVSAIPFPVFTVSARDFLPSLTFIPSTPFNYLSGADRYHWMDDAYWSLWVEVRFYALIGALYFAQKPRFGRNLMYACLIILGAYALATGVHWKSGTRLINDAFIAEELPWFLIGVGFYFRRTEKPWRLFLALALCSLVVQMLMRAQPGALAATAVLVPLAFWFGETIGSQILSAKWLTAVGVASYSLYLLHQYIGVSVIHSLGRGLGIRGPATIAVPILVASLMILLTRQIYLRWENPLNQWIVQLLLHGRIQSLRNQEGRVTSLKPR
jgi:peptidoglycan/LPS O-acetylase OafA/YrhL